MADKFEGACRKAKSNLRRPGIKADHPGRYQIDHPDTDMPVPSRAFQMWAVHPLDLDEFGLSREEFYEAHLKAIEKTTLMAKINLSSIDLLEKIFDAGSKSLMDRSANLESRKEIILKIVADHFSTKNDEKI